MKSSVLVSFMYMLLNAKSLQSCLTLCDPIDGSPPGSPRPWNSPGKNPEVACHFLLQCMKVKSESEVAQSYPTFSYPMDCSPPGFSIHGIFQARVLEWGAIAVSVQACQGSNFQLIDDTHILLAFLVQIHNALAQDQIPESLHD